jgi:hypothetical protein
MLIVHSGWVKSSVAKSNSTKSILSFEQSAQETFNFVNSDFESGIF